MELRKALRNVAGAGAIAATAATSFGSAASAHELYDQYGRPAPHRHEGGSSQPNGGDIAGAILFGIITGTIIKELKDNDRGRGGYRPHRPHREHCHYGGYNHRPRGWHCHRW